MDQDFMAHIEWYSEKTEEKTSVSCQNMQFATGLSDHIDHLEP